MPSRYSLTSGLSSGAPPVELLAIVPSCWLSWLRTSMSGMGDAGLSLSDRELIVKRSRIVQDRGSCATFGGELYLLGYTALPCRVTDPIHKRSGIYRRRPLGAREGEVQEKAGSGPGCPAGSWSAPPGNPDLG